MNSSLEALKKDLESLKLYVEFQNESNKVANKHFKSTGIKQFANLELSKIKRFNYNTYIVSLYGAIERFLENISLKFLSTLTSHLNEYKSLPEKIKENNIIKNIEILANLNLKRNKDLKAETLIKILNDNLNNDIPILNNEAFVQHKSNFRISIIDVFFKNLGVESLSNSVRHYDPIKQILEEKFSDLFLKESSLVFSIINDIADIRNDIAHGVDNVEILHQSILNEYIDFTIAFCESIHNLMSDEVLKIIFLNKCIPIKPIAVYNNSVLCFELKNWGLTKNDKIIIRRENVYPKNVVSNISQIQIDKKEVEFVGDTEVINVGILLDCKIKINNEFGILKHEQFDLVS